MGILLTIIIGIASLVVAGIVFESTVLQFVVGIIVAVILVTLVARLTGGRERGLART